MTTLVYSGNLVIKTCWCGIRHAIPSELARQATHNGRAVFCPLGHEWVVKETEAERLERELAAERRRVDATRELLQFEQRSHSATRGHLTRAKKRAAAGVCPVPGCGRSFSQLGWHMRAKHPDFVDEAKDA